MFRIWRIALAASLVALAFACGGQSRVTTTTLDTTWQKIYDRPADFATSIEMFDDQYGLAVIGQGIERTTDGGRTWHEMYKDAEGAGQIVFADEQSAWITAGVGALLRTSDGGLTWERKATPASAPFTGMAVVSADEVWLSAYHAPVQGIPPHGPSALLHTTDGGTTWQSVDVRGYGIFLGVWFAGDDGWLLATQCHPGDPQDIPMAEPGTPGHPPCNDQSTLLHTPDDGRSWSALAASAATGGGITRIDRLNGYSLAGCGPNCDTRRLYKTSDGGQTWTDIGLPPLGSNDAIRGYRFAGFDGWLGVMQLAPPTSPPSAPEFINRLAHTGDGGRTWEYVDLPGESSFAFDMAGGAVVASAAGTGISRYDPAARSWQPASTDAGPELTRIVFETRDVGYATDRDYALWATADGGATWSLRSGAFSWNFAPDGVLWGYDKNLAIHLSDDGGHTTRELTHMPPDQTPSSGGVVVAAASGSVSLQRVDGLWRTDDAGATWRHVDVAPYAQYHFVDSQHAWTETCGARPCGESIRLTSDGGATWNIRAVPPNTYIGDVTFGTALDGWVPVRESPGDCRCIVATHDGGRTWQTVSTAPWSLGSMVWLDASRAWGIVNFLSPAQPSVIVSTVDAGTTWREEFTFEQAAARLVGRDGRVWLYINTSPVNLPDGAYQPPRRTVIYRRDVADLPRAVATQDVGVSGQRGMAALLLATLGTTLAFRLRRRS